MLSIHCHVVDIILRFSSLFCLDIHPMRAPFGLMMIVLFVVAVTTPVMAANIVPHRALYDMTLKSIKNGSKIADVKGRMMFSWDDACDAWTTEQRIQYRFLYSEGDVVEILTSMASLESKDGQSMTFHLKRSTNGKDEEVFRGTASRGLTGSGKSLYSLPANHEVSFDADTLFPTTHTIEMLKRAKAGDKMFNSNVYDGSDEKGISEINVLIGQKNSTPTQGALKDSPLLTGDAYPVHMAFYEPDEQNATPDYEMDMKIGENGIVRALSIDYGDFAVAGTLTQLETLPNKCP
jgi:EipB-like